MKFYPKTYEDAFTSEKLLRKCKLEQVNIFGNLTIQEYKSEMLNLLKKYERQTFNFLVKHEWLARKFGYFGRQKRKDSGHSVDGAFGVFLRHHIGRDNRLYTRSRFYSQITSYFPEMFPDFEDNNPFEQPYELPFSNVGLDHMSVVYQMDERMEILRYIDEHPMQFTEFIDWIINWVLCYTDENGPKYVFRQPEYRPPVVQKLKEKNGKRKTKKTKAGCVYRRKE